MQQLPSSGAWEPSTQDRAPGSGPGQRADHSAPRLGAPSEKSQEENTLRAPAGYSHRLTGPSKNSSSLLNTYCVPLNGLGA